VSSRAISRHVVALSGTTPLHVAAVDGDVRATANALLPAGAKLR